MTDPAPAQDSLSPSGQIPFTGTAAADAAALPLPGARAALVLLLAINLFNFVDRQVLASVEVLVGKDIHAGEDKMGWTQTAFIVSYMLLSPLFGWLGDRTSRWLLIGIGVIAWSLASGATGLAHGFVALMITRCFVGVGEAAYGPVAPTLLSDLYPVRDRGWVLSFFYLAIPVGSALGYVLGGAIATALSWRWAFYLVVPPGLILGAAALFMREPPRGSADRMEAADGAAMPDARRGLHGSTFGAGKDGSTFGAGDAQAAGSRRDVSDSISAAKSAPPAATLADYLTLLRTPSYVLCTLGMTALTFALGGIGFWMPRYVYQLGTVGSLAKVNLIFGGIVVVSGLFGTLVGGWAGDALRGRVRGAYFLVSAAGLLVGFPVSLLMLYAPFPLAWLFVFLACFCLFFNTGPSNAILANVTHPSIRASAFAVNILVIHLFGDAISPPVIGMIAHAASLRLGFVVVSFTMLLGGVIWLAGASYLDADTAAAPNRIAQRRHDIIASI
jgi:MFS family permease